MEVDDDSVDQDLLLQFTCLGTTDRDDLVKHFKELIDNRVNDSTANFFLEMNNWNLQNAICSFFDYEIPNKTLTMTLEEGKIYLNDHNVSHTVPSVILEKGRIFSSLSMPPGTKFTMMWIIRNSGDESWPHGCILQHISGNHPCSVEVVPVTTLKPSCSATIQVDFITPAESGLYQSKWQMMTPCGTYFGEVLWVMFQVRVKLNNMEEMNLSEELASRMALIENTDRKLAKNEVNTRHNNSLSNSFSVSSIIFKDKTNCDLDQTQNIDQGENETS